MCGLLLAGFITIMGCANMIIMIILWILYHSIVNVGQRWYVFKLKIIKGVSGNLARTTNFIKNIIVLFETLDLSVLLQTINIMDFNTYTPTHTHTHTHTHIYI